MQVGDIVEYYGERAILHQLNDTFAEINYTDYPKLSQVVPIKELKLIEALSTITIKINLEID